MPQSCECTHLAGFHELGTPTASLRRALRRLLEPPIHVGNGSGVNFDGRFQGVDRGVEGEQPQQARKGVCLEIRAKICAPWLESGQRSMPWCDFS